MANRPDIVYCNECSREAGERPFASAPRVDVWLLLEYNAAWADKALPKSDLTQAVKERLFHCLNNTTNSKFLFIRQRDSQPHGPRLYVALTREVEPRLYRFDLTTYDDLLTLDLEAVAQGSASFDAHITHEPLVTVCTNGRRDIACSKYGVPVYNALVEEAGVSVWQSTHPGGHRFAGVAVSLPSGVCYGYLDADDASDLVRAVQRNEVMTENTRGRSCYDAPAQAADYFLRGITGVVNIDGFRLLSQTADEATADQWIVRFDVLPEARAYEVVVRRELSSFTTFESSGDTEPAHVPQYHLVQYAALT